MTLELERYETQRAVWPASGRHVLAQFDDRTIVVYQAYRPEIGHYAAEHGTFGGAFSFSRMTWIKPNFLWMMFRSDWGRKEGQEVILAVVMLRSGFEALLAEAVSSTYWPSYHASERAWKEALHDSSVRLQWDPDHGPSGAPLERRAIQLGIRGPTLKRWVSEWIVGIDDISSYVAEQREQSRPELVLPRERVYPVPEPLRSNLGMAST